MLTSKKKGYRLSPETVDLLSQEFADSLTEAEADRKDILRLRLSLEEILEGWSSALPGAPVTFCAKKRLGRQRIEIRVEGKELQADDVLKNCLLSSRLLAQAGLTLTQSYQNGENCLTVEPPRKRKLGQMQKLLLAIVSAVVLGLLQRLLPASAQAGVRAVTDPLFTLILNLLRTISHDLRTPLTSISGNAGVLMENSSVLDEATNQRLYADIYDDSMWLVQLVENLLSITRLENGGLDLRIQPELLEEVAGEALQHLNRRSAEYPIRVDIEDDLLMAKMDSRLITQVIINIVNNAVKYTPPGTDITLSARREGDTVRVEIADTGPGIPQEAQGRLFQMFYTAGNDRGDGRRGLGLGLALCKSIVEAHGGKIGMRANEPHGSVFFFTLQAEEIKL